ncbi:hypothetical protein A9Q99_16190 [Gammaproteobacteria bacterium 45_16_T64]|nr:hypothetical protein A9Q99_16190 [Gammaproteobacteria bacterium 45_16_T64]
MTFPADFPIIDPHIHQWDLKHTPRALTWPKKLLGWNNGLYERAIMLGAKKSDRDYVGKVDHVAHNYLPETYRQDVRHLNLQQIVHVEADWKDKSGLGPVGETLWVDSLFRSQSNIDLGALIGYVDFRKGNVLGILDAHRKASKKFVGVRQMLAWDHDKGIMRFCDQAKLSQDVRWRQGFDLFARYDLSFEAWFFHHQLDEMVTLARAYPNIRFVLCHMGTPIGLGGEFSTYGKTSKGRESTLRQWQEGMAKVAECPNVQVKLSGFFMPVVGWGYHLLNQPPSCEQVLDDVQPMFEFVLKHFGVDRCMFASNFPMDKASMSFATLYDLYWTLCEGMEHDDKIKVFHDNAKTHYRLHN